MTSAKRGSRKWMVEAVLVAVAVLIGAGVACAVREWRSHQAKDVVKSVESPE